MVKRAVRRAQTRNPGRKGTLHLQARIQKRAVLLGPQKQRKPSRSHKATAQKREYICGQNVYKTKTPYQYRELVRLWRSCPNYTKHDYVAIAKRLGLTRDQVYKWFWTRRFTKPTDSDSE